MEQRPLRLGDLVDDYCPRERRVTNHVIVALVEDAIRQTRCSTCDTEHVFKAGRLPRRRAKDGDVSVADIPNGQAVMSDGAARVEPDEAPVEMTVEASSDAVNGQEREQEEERTEPLWPANRTLIRAQLPRVEGEQPPPRPIPEFTIYQRNNGRNAGGFRRGGGGGGGWAGRGGGNGQEPNGNRAGNDRRNGHAGGAGFGTGQGQGQGRRRHGKRRPPR